MKNIQKQYADLLEGKMSKANFVRNVRMQFPQYVSSTTSYEDSIKILKGKRILSEAKLPDGVYGHNTNAETQVARGIDHLNYYQVYNGIQYELSKMPEITDETYIAARKKVVDAILKDPHAYMELKLANYKNVKEMDEDLKMKEVKENNLVDKANGMKTMKKDPVANTMDTYNKKEKKKNKNGKGLDHMTMAPAGNLEAFPTPGKEKTLKEHILDELTSANPNYAEYTAGTRVKKKDESLVGEIVEWDGDTATIKTDEGKVVHLQGNVLTKEDVPSKKEENTEKMSSTDEWANYGVRERKEEERKEKIKDLKEKLIKAMKKEGYALKTKTGKTIETGKDTANAIQKAKNLEKSTGDQLTVVDLTRGTEKDV